MKLRMYQVDAFASRVFEGNPAAVVPLAQWPDERLLQAIAEENNLSETAFFVQAGGAFELRWFTPVAEVDLCGHATLAAAHVLFDALGHPGPTILFSTRSGMLPVQRIGAHLVMDFPARPPVACAAPPELVAALGLAPMAVLAADDYLAVYADEDDVRALQPDIAGLRALDRRGVIATAPGREADFVSRFFAPKLGIAEDPVTGSAHCALAPYWAERLGRTALVGRQVSRRGGTVGCELRNERVFLAGGAVTYMVAEIDVA